MQEAPYSFNFFVTTPEGAGGQFTVRHDELGEFLKRIDDLTSVIAAGGFEFGKSNAPARQVPTSGNIMPTQSGGDYPLPIKVETFIGFMGFTAKSGPAIAFYKAGLKFQDLTVWSEDLHRIQELADMVDWAKAPGEYVTLEKATEEGYFIAHNATLEVEQRTGKDGQPEVNKNDYPVFKISRRPGANQEYSGSPSTHVSGNSNSENRLNDRQLNNLTGLAADVYGNETDEKLKLITLTLTRKRTDDPAKLTPEEAEQAIAGIQKKLDEMVQEEEEIPF